MAVIIINALYYVYVYKSIFPCLQVQQFLYNAFSFMESRLPYWIIWKCMLIVQVKEDETAGESHDLGRLADLNHIMYFIY
jgi:hypothetical protein